ncbi:MAG: DUF1902 domain-containing protein [Candidatus Margulisbacteria bacterium]|jgi:hypothetical protein|nr:DUF1902 domain-containing protein [Candidatus Margulisiibacteriota bacterium]
MEYSISLTWDEEAQVWVAVNDDIPIALESGSLDALIERVKLAVPEVLALNKQVPQGDVRLRFKAERLTLAA